MVSVITNSNNKKERKKETINALSKSKSNQSTPIVLEYCSASRFKDRKEKNTSNV